MGLKSRIGSQRRQQGFTYLLALFAMAALAILTTRALENFQMTERREREMALLEIGSAYRAAIEMYYEQSPGTQKAYPRDLATLLLDTRAVRIRRPLRRLYRDPVSASAEWGIVRASDGGIMGVFSLSDRAPVKTDGFASAFEHFVGAASYRDWKFVYEPPLAEIGADKKNGGI